MKLVAVLSLDHDRDHLHRIFRNRKIDVYSELNVTGHEQPGSIGAADVGWFGGGMPPANSTLAFAFLDDAPACDLMDAIDAFNQGRPDARPVRAFSMPVERTAPQTSSD